MISVLVPSRERANALKESLASLGPVGEVLVRIDGDDTQIADYVSMKALKLLIGPRLGYEHLNEYYNDMADIAEGDWLMLWNDDCIMKTPDWQEKINKHDPTRPCVLNIHKPGHNYFPIVSRAFYEALGQFS